MPFHFIHDVFHLRGCLHQGPRSCPNYMIFIFTVALQGATFMVTFVIYAILKVFGPLTRSKLSGPRGVTMYPKSGCDGFLIYVKKGGFQKNHVFTLLLFSFLFFSSP